jgi:hypothetical protein
MSSDICNDPLNKQLDKLSQIFDTIIIPHKVEAYWQHERFLKKRGWDPVDEDDLLIHLPPSQDKDGKDEFIQKHQEAREDIRLYRLHQQRLDEIAAAKRDGQERLTVHNRLRNVEPLTNRERRFVGVSNSQQKRKSETTAWDFFNWFDAVIICLFLLLLLVSGIIMKKRK